MSGRFVRASSYRHVHGKTPKPELEYQDLKPTFSGEGNHIAVSDKFFAYSATGGGGPVVVWPINKTGRLPLNTPMLTVHKDQVLDYDFSPFNGNLLATAGEDLVVKISQIPDEGLKGHVSESAASLEGHERKVTTLHFHPTANNILGSASLEGHERKVTTLHFHPTANNILGSASADLSVRVWDIEKQSQLSSFEFPDTVHSFDWNPDGSLLAASSKDLQLRVFDPRTTGSVLSGQGFTGPKTSRVVWRGDKGQIIALGSSKSSARQYGLWDIKNLSQPLQLVDIDTSAGVLIPFYDADTGMLYAGGKGDGNIRYWEVVDTDPYVHFLSEFRDNQSQKGLAIAPKRTVDTKQCEVATIYRLMKDKVIPVSFQVPRKSADQFQKDIYPEAYAGVPSISADEYAAGKNGEPKKISLDPKQKGTAGPVAAVQTSFKAQKSAADLQKELDAANARIAELEAELAKLKK